MSRTYNSKGLFKESLVFWLVTESQNKKLATYLYLFQGVLQLRVQFTGERRHVKVSLAMKTVPNLAPKPVGDLNIPNSSSVVRQKIVTN